MRRDEPVDLGLQRLAGSGIVERIEVVDVQLVGLLRAVGQILQRNQAAVRTGPLDDRFDLCLGQDTAQGVQADAVVGGKEVEECRARWQFQSTGPAGTLGAGYAQGIGAQVALDREGRGRKALVVAGDGGFLFTGSELATAVQHDIPLVCCIFDDGAYGNVKRIQQQRFGDQRTIASTLRNPDFVAYARAFGALGLHADGPDALRATLDEAFSADAPALIHVSTGPMPDPWPWFPRSLVR